MQTTITKVILKATIVNYGIKYVTEAVKENGEVIEIRDTTESAAIETATQVVNVDSDKYKSTAVGYYFQIYNAKNELTASTFEMSV